MTVNDKISRQRAYQLLVVQSVIGIVVACIFAASQSLMAGYSALLGLLVTLLPSSIFVLIVFRKPVIVDGKRTLMTFYKAEVTKFCLIALLLISILRYLPITPLSFMLTFVATQLSPLFLPLFFRRPLVEAR